MRRILTARKEELRLDGVGEAKGNLVGQSFERGRSLSTLPCQEGDIGNSPGARTAKNVDNSGSNQRENYANVTVEYVSHSCPDYEASWSPHPRRVLGVVPRVPLAVLHRTECAGGGARACCVVLVLSQRVDAV